MKFTGIISALVFAHVALGQAADPSSTVSTSTSGTKGTKSASTSHTQSSSASAPVATPTGSTSSDSLTQSTSDPLIPSGISDACSTFLSALNSDAQMSGCFNSLNTALSSFTSSSGSASAVSKSLNSLCSVNSCSGSTMRPKLTEFKDACSDELTTNEMVAKQYDVWYAIIPFRDAICVKDNDQYCLLNTGSSSSNTSNTRRSDVSYAASHLTSKRAQTVLMPNADTYSKSHLMYLFISPDMTTEQFCTTCTQKILAKYAAFGSSTPYALGNNKSPILSGQAELWSAATEKCPADFVQGIYTIANVASADDLAGSAVTTTASYFTALAAAFAAALALF